MKKIITITILTFILLNTIIFADIVKTTNDNDSIMVVDFNSDKVLYQKNQFTKYEIGDITKLMTYLIVMEEISLYIEKTLYSEVTIAQNVLSSTKKEAVLKDGDIFSVEKLLKIMLLTNQNDATNALAIFVSKNKESFLKKMNRKAKKLGLNSTNFLTVTGEKTQISQNTSTSFDVFRLSKHILKNYPLTLKYFKTDKLKFSNVIMTPNIVEYKTKSPNINGLIFSKKDSSTQNAVVTFNVKRKNTTQPFTIVVVVLNSKSNDHLKKTIDEIYTNINNDITITDINNIKNLDLKTLTTNTFLYNLYKNNIIFDTRKEVLNVSY